MHFKIKNFISFPLDILLAEWKMMHVFMSIRKILKGWCVFADTRHYFDSPKENV